MNKDTTTGISRDYQRAKWFGIVFIIIGLFLSVHGSVSLYNLYHTKSLMFVFDQGLSPEKGQNWVKLLTGASVMLLGVALILFARKKKLSL